MFKKEEILDLTEPRSVIATILPLTVGILFSIYNFNKFSLVGTIVFAVVAVLMQTAVNTWNNIADFRRNDSKWAKNSVNNSISEIQGSENRAWILLFVQILVVAVGGLYLVFNSKIGLWILILGLLASLVGYLYSGVNFALSWTAFGELFSGVTMGFVIFLAAVLVNIDQISVYIVWSVALTSIIAVTAIANIMLANNISDAKEDLQMGRHTLVYYLGTNGSLHFFSLLYIIGYATTGLSIAFGFLPLSAALVYLSIPFVFINVRKFYILQSKRVTFVLSVKNALIITALLVLGMMIGILIK